MGLRARFPRGSTQGNDVHRQAELAGTPAAGEALCVAMELQKRAFVKGAPAVDGDCPSEYVEAMTLWQDAALLGAQEAFDEARRLWIVGNELLGAIAAQLGR